MAQSIEKQIEVAVRKLDMYAAKLGRDRKRILEYSAVPVVDVMRQKAPKGTRIHYRYATKGKNVPRAAKGQGERVAKYLPGHLRGSVMMLPFKKASGVFIGPKFSKGSSKGTFGGRRFDAYYAHMVEFGTKNTMAQPFIRPAADLGLPVAKRRIELAIKQLTNKFNQRHSV